jgi:hypothetical protein
MLSNVSLVTIYTEVEFSMIVQVLRINKTRAEARGGLPNMEAKLGKRFALCAFTALHTYTGSLME